MVQLMEVSVKGGPGKIRHPKLKNKDLLDIFTQLADGQEGHRPKCTERLITFLADQENSYEEGLCDDTKYSVRRLVHGLSSGRQFARLGYSVALCQLLRSIQKVDLQLLFGHINEAAQNYGGSKELLSRNACIGKVFAYLVLIQSKKLFSGESQQISTVVQDLMKISAEKDYMPHLCMVAVSQIISQIKHKTFQKHVLPNIDGSLSTGWSNCSPDVLLLAIFAKKHHHKVMEPYLKEKWGDSDLISEATFSHLAEVFKKTTHLNPIIHSVVDVVVEEVIQNELDLVTFWNTVVGPLFAGKSKAHTVELYIFEKLIPHITSPKQVKGILLPDIAKQLADHNKEAVAKVMTLVKGTSHGMTQLSVLKCLVQQVKLPVDDLMNEMVANFVPDAVSSLKKELTKAYTLQPSWITDKKDVVPWCKWCASALNNLVTYGNDTDWQLSILQFLFIHSFFTVKKSSNIPHCTSQEGEHPDHVRTITGQHFTKAMTRLLSHNKKSISRSMQFNQHLDVLFQLAEYGQVLLHNTDCVELLSPCFNEEARQQWTRMMEFLPTLQSKRSTSEKLGLDHAFELMFIYGGLQLFSDPSAVEFLQELHMCYKKSTQRRKSKAANEEPAWIEVITELLLSLMFKGSLFSRNIAKIAMAALADHVTTEALQLILDALQQKSVNDDEGMLGLEEEDEEEDVPDDKTNSNNGSDAEDDNDDDKKEVKSDEVDDGDEEEEEVNSDDDDEDSGDESESSVDSGVEEEPGIEVPDDVKSQIKEALGDAAAADDDDERLEDDKDLTDAEMFQLDAKLAEAFKAMNKTKNKKLDKERKEQMLQFKARSFDFLDVIVKNNPSAHLIKEMIIPLIDRMEGGQRVEKEQILAQKAKGVFDLMCKTKMVMSDTVDKDELLEMFSVLMKLSVKVSSDAVLAQVVKGCVLIIRMMFNLQGHTDPSPVKTRSKHKPDSTITSSKQKHDVYQDKLVSLVLSGITDLFHKKEGQGSMGFFCRLLEYNIIMLWPIWKGLIEVIGSVEIKTYRRASAASFLSRLLNKQLVRELGSEEWSLFLSEIRSLSQKVLKVIGPKEKHFINELLNLFVKIYDVSTDDNINILGEAEMKILEGMMASYNHETMSLFRKVYNFVYKEQLPNKQKRRKEEKLKAEAAPPEKKLKLDSVQNGNHGDSEDGSMDEGVESMDTTVTPITNGVLKKKKKPKNLPDKADQINEVNSNTAEKSTPGSTSVNVLKTPSDPQVTSSKKKKNKKKQRQSGEMVVNDAEEMETDVLNDVNVPEPENSLDALKGGLNVLSSEQNVATPGSGKKKKRKSDKFSPRYTRSMKP